MLIPQVERFAGKYVFAKLSPKVMDTAIMAMIAKSEKMTGNKYVFICNSRMWNEIQTTLRNYLRDWKPTCTLMYSQAENDYINVDSIKVGNTFSSYEFGGKLCCLLAA